MTISSIVAYTGIITIALVQILRNFELLQSHKVSVNAQYEGGSSEFAVDESDPFNDIRHKEHLRE